jgi:hypothetical protein
MAAIRSSWWKLVGLILLGDLVYLAALILLLRRLEHTNLGQMMFQFLAVLYWPLPAALSLLGLFFSGFLSIRADPMRTVFLIAWSIVLPGFALASIIFGSMHACHLGLVPNCRPY